MHLLPLINLWTSGRIGSQFVSSAPQRKLGYAVFFCALILIASVPAMAVTHVVAHARVHHSHHAVLRTAVSTRHYRGHYQVGLGRWTPMFPGSHDMLVRENEELDRMQLPRINDDYELTRYELSQDLVPVSESDGLKIAADLPDNRRYCRPWTRDFLQDFSAAFYEQFHTPIQVNSLVRTVEQQHRLRRWNRFAAPEFGDTASTHLTGVTFDMSRRGLTYEQYEWIRNYLLPLQAQGMVDPIEERQPVLHVVVYEKYSGRNDQKNAWSEANEATEMDPYGAAATPAALVGPAPTGSVVAAGSQP
ncbi:MAG TPA: DUF5715 family protein [Verrucomicrobiae bacterium]|jgi:hypothetical protein|nr:DUF5715 family protein [Verrucomicrobiae bacterium]